MECVEMLAREMHAAWCELYNAGVLAEWDALSEFGKADWLERANGVLEQVSRALDVPLDKLLDFSSSYDRDPERG